MATILQNSNGEIDQESLKVLNDAVCLKLEELFLLLEISLQKSGRCFIGCCPIHGGNNPTALNIYPEGYKMGGFWKCNTKKCHTYFAQNIIGFTRAVLSRKRYGWIKKGDKEVGFNQTIEYLTKFIGKELKVNYDNIGKKKFCSEVQLYTKKVERKNKGIHRNQMRSWLKIPSHKYIERGYSKEILDKYDVGLFVNPKHELNNKIIVPVYDDKLILVGVQARSIYDKCNKCELHHSSGPCPRNEEKGLYSKWVNGKNFNCGSNLYNLWYAKKHIQDTRSIILVEGPGDVWRLEEAGIHNSVALFGSNFTEQQEILIETSGATTIIILTDNDEAGRIVRDTIKKRCQRLYNIVCPELKKHDVGDMTVEEVKSDLVPILKSIERQF